MSNKPTMLKIYFGDNLSSNACKLDNKSYIIIDELLQHISWLDFTQVNIENCDTYSELKFKCEHMDTDIIVRFEQHGNLDNTQYLVDGMECNDIVDAAWTLSTLLD